MIAGNQRPDIIASGGEGDTVSVKTRQVRGHLERAGIVSAQLDARLLVCAATRISHEQFIADPQRPINAMHAGVLDTFVARRLKREPVSRIIGEREFWGRRFAVTPATLDPRGDTETLLDAVLENQWLSRRAAPVIADLGTGTGCLVISLLCEYDTVTGVGIDISHDAVITARDNASALGVGERARFMCGDWLASLDVQFDLIVSNPPYVCSRQIAGLEPEVAQYEPRVALDGGVDGIDCYRKISHEARTRLKRDGVLVLELGAGQDGPVSNVLAQQGYLVLGKRRDLSGTVRCLWATPVR